MRWELRARAVERGICTAAGMRRRLAAAGLAVSVGKMSALWSGLPVSVRLDDLEMLCLVLACEPSDLLVRQRSGPVPAGSAAGRPAGDPSLANHLSTTPAAGLAAAVPAAAGKGRGLACRPLPPL
ncbi:helix-turn-helix domain-containing protein [Streptomyces sp. NPDC002952]|uniref:helix-turn-helix domain-containing protein n=1 Tax=Streptomyces sp. NPDC002952 TaxID=3364673 RepID=UPI0036B2CFEE